MYFVYNKIFIMCYDQPAVYFSYFSHTRFHYCNLLNKNCFKNFCIRIPFGEKNDFQK